MATTHTPGPWHCSALPHVPMLSAYTYERDETGDDQRVALPVTDANAALIAAAPDLLAALQWALEQIEDDLDPDHQAALAAAQATIARATGKSA